MNRAAINPKLITWARKRAGLKTSALEKRFPQIRKWEEGESSPTFRQLENFAGATLTPFGAFFLQEPPIEELPVPDYRTVSEKKPQKPSAALLETIYQMERRQEWMRDFLIEEGEETLSFIGSMRREPDSVKIASDIRNTLGISNGWAEQTSTWEEALLQMRRAVESVGIIVVINGVVGNNTSQKLDPQEFRGFVLCDDYAPLIFINGADYKSSQMFTLAHELAHLWLGKGGVFDLPRLQPSAHELEIFCNKVAAEILVPRAELETSWHDAWNQKEPFQYLARLFKVSPIVAARSALDHGLIEPEEFFDFWNSYQKDERRKRANKKSGGDFFRTQEVRVGHRFGAAVVHAAQSGKLLYPEAYRLTNLQGKSFDKFAKKIGFGPR